MVPSVKLLLFSLALLSLSGCASNPPSAHTSHPDSLLALEYLKSLEGQWLVQGGNEGPFGWTFDVTARGNIVIERLKVGTETEMATVYSIQDDGLIASHFCQLQNQPRLRAVTSEIDGDLHFLCDGNVTNAESHDELHMHGVHFRKEGVRLIVWMDMLENEELAFQTSYTLVRAEP
jgi:hypothetical protein